ncbi:uncharacterized protein N7469_000583 [Penicillium citrinum]|uniref:Uncharacterized protein n=1 Tax=Penicillium citrinum TaxID=5077 RepID=A0A9W9PD54_PENCI|nr:uncharacterized protein N7469_000583 [Penicillium citrinum]KAJ5242256.1 hypothetical protein N7469_000583 [Penicillium citrinum]
MRSGEAIQYTIVYTEDLSVEENLQLAQQLNQPVEDNGIVFYAQSDLSIQQNQSWMQKDWPQNQFV